MPAVFDSLFWHPNVYNVEQVTTLLPTQNHFQAISALSWFLFQDMELQKVTVFFTSQ